MKKLIGKSDIIKVLVSFSIGLSVGLNIFFLIEQYQNHSKYNYESYSTFGISQEELQKVAKLYTEARESYYNANFLAACDQLDMLHQSVKWFEDSRRMRVYCSQGVKALATDKFGLKSDTK